MFPLAHNLLIVRLLKHPLAPLGSNLTVQEEQLLKVGSVLPDLVSAMDMDRNFGHLMGKDLYNFVSQNYPAYKPLALGAWLHGADPCGFDYYADEAWEDGLGWCFQKAEAYKNQVKAACNLPENISLWKAHNFIEMAAELETQRHYPNLATELLVARNDPEIQAIVTKVMVEFGKANPAKVAPILARVSQIFALQQTTALTLAEKYYDQLVFRHGVSGGDVNKMANIILTIQNDYSKEFWQWLDLVESKIIKNLKLNQIF